MKKTVLILLLFSLSISQDFIHKCGFSHNQLRMARPNLNYFTLSPSGDFRIHYNTSGQHTASTAYINAVGQAADDAKNLLNSMGFLPVIDDADGKYDIYLKNLSPMGNYGYNSSDCGGYWSNTLEYACSADEVPGASFIVIDNNYDYSCSNFQTSSFCVDENSGTDVMKVTLLHEYFHAVQRSYLSPLALEQLHDTYFMELISTWIEDVGYPDVNDYLNFAYPYLLAPDLNISTYEPVSDYDPGYSLALFGHYLTKIYDDVDNEEDGVIIKKILESFTGDYKGQARDAIDDVLINDYNSTFAQAWSDFNARNTFNGEFNDSYNQIYYYEDQKYINPILCSLDDCWNDICPTWLDQCCGCWDDINISSLSFSTTSDLLNQEGAASIKSYQVDNLSFLDFLFNMDTQIIGEDFAASVAIESTNPLHHRIYDLNYFLNYTCSDAGWGNQDDCEDNGDVWGPISSNIIALDMIDKIHVIGAFNGSSTEAYGNIFNLGFSLNYSTLDNYDLGDSNLDGVINVIDITSLIAFILENTNISEYQFNLIDMNNDLNVNIVDVITLVNVILDS